MANVGLGSSLVKTVMLKIVGDAGDANKTLDEIAAKAEALKEEHPELTVSINRAKATADAIVVKAEMRRVLGEPIKVEVTPDVDTNKAASVLSRIIGGVFGSKLGGLFGGSGGGVGGGIPGIGGVLGAIGPAGALAGIGILGGTGVLGVLPALLAALTGLGAFVALAYPTISAITGGVTATATAASNLATAQANLTAAKATYQKDPTQANLDALKTAQTALTTATQAQTAAWAALDPAQQKVVRGIQGLQSNFSTLAQNFEPFVIQVAGLALQIGNKLLPVLGQFANAAAPAVITLFKQLNTAVSSPAFKQFVDQMAKLVPGTLIAVGQGLGQIAGALGNVAKASVKVNDQTKILTIGLDAIAGSLNTVAFLATASASALNGIISFLSWLTGVFPLPGSSLPPGNSSLGPGGSLGQTVAGVVGQISGAPGFGPGQRHLPINAATFAGAGGIQVTVSMTGSDALSRAIMQSVRAEVNVKGGGGTNSVQRTFGKRF